MFPKTEASRPLATAAALNEVPTHLFQQPGYCSPTAAPVDWNESTARRSAYAVGAPCDMKTAWFAHGTG